MSYNNAIPQATDQISQSQADILANFQAIKTLVDINHVTFDISDQGKHKFLQLPEQASAPTVAANEAGLYSKEGAQTTKTELAFRRESNGDVIEFTAWGQNTTASGGYTRLPSGVLLKWGTQSGVNGLSAPVTITYPTTTGAAGTPDINKTIPAFTAVFFVGVTVLSATQTAAYGSADTISGTLSFPVVTSVNNATIRYIAIGI